MPRLAKLSSKRNAVQLQVSRISQAAGVNYCTTLDQSLMSNQASSQKPSTFYAREEEEEEGFYMLRPVSKTDHMCQDIKVLTKH